jgi:hypothetical protein
MQHRTRHCLDGARMITYGGPYHGRVTIVTLQEAIRHLLSIHTMRTGDGSIRVLYNATPIMTGDDERLYKESWEMLNASMKTAEKPPAAEINPDWIAEAEFAAHTAAEISLDPALFLKLLAVAKNGLGPRLVR